jgi:hypothetical protein
MASFNRRASLRTAKGEVRLSMKKTSTVALCISAIARA